MPTSKALQAKHKGRNKIYTVWQGSDPKGIKWIKPGSRRDVLWSHPLDSMELTMPLVKDVTRAKYHELVSGMEAD